MKKLSLTKRISLSGVIVALAVLVEFIHFPLFPSAPFLEYDAAGIILLIGALILGPGYGVILSFITAILHVFFGGNAGLYGILMNGVALAAFVTITTGILKLMKVSLFTNGNQNMNKSESFEQSKIKNEVVGTSTNNKRKSNKKIPLYLASSLAAILLTTAFMIPLNFVLTPMFLGQPIEVVKDLLVFPIIPFNLVKWGINAIVGFILFEVLNKARVIEKLGK